MRAHLILKDGAVFRGRAPLGFGGSGEAVFTTAMAGYQEILTDPSFAGQLVTMTFPEQVRPHFRALRALRDILQSRSPGPLSLSMGMSGDFEVAIEEGADLIRIGTALFGPRLVP